MVSLYDRVFVRGDEAPWKSRVTVICQGRVVVSLSVVVSVYGRVVVILYGRVVVSV